jgi:DNA-binding MarR family transcriptional regulator
MVKKDITKFSQEVFDLVPHLIRGMFKRKMDALGKGYITLPQYLSLELIDSHGSLKMKEIAKELNVSLPAATGMIDRLYHLSLVKREFEPKDRRVIKIVLTAKGKKVLADVREKRRKAIEEVFSNLSEKERQSYLRILRKVKDILYEKK